MKEMSYVKKSIITAVCIALCYILPMLFHGIPNAGSIFCPMHIPVFLCGLVAGWPFGLLCGIAGPALSSVRTKNIYADLYISLIAAIVCGRILAGITKALIFSAGSYSMDAWVSGYVVTSWPGTLIQLIFIPSIVFALMKAHLIPERYPGTDR